MSARPKKIKLLVADDQNLFRDLIIGRLKRDLEIQVVGAAVSGRDTIDKVQQLTPDVVLLDIQLGDMDGIEVTQAIKGSKPETKVVLLTGFHSRESIYKAFQFGASGYLSKDASIDTVLEHVRAAHKGESLLDPEATTRLIREMEVGKGRNAPAEDRLREKTDILDELTQREYEILGLIADGLSNQQIAGNLFISEYTVKTHISNLFRKLAINDRVQAVLKALEAGIR
ncbi:MAG: response regulator transcription factor [Armatimonadetes bacterium]|nr:response regulator transcription factor [Armatimonadota bacterium]